MVILVLGSPCVSNVPDSIEKSLSILILVFSLLALMYKFLILCLVALIQIVVLSPQSIFTFLKLGISLTNFITLFEP